MHQRSVLGPLLFIVVLEALSEEFVEGLPLELLCAYGLVLMAGSGELLLERMGSGMEAWGHEVSAGGTYTY